MACYFRNLSIKFGKKGAELWVSWVFLLAFVILIGVFASNFLMQYSKSASERLKRVVDGDACNYVGLVMAETCQTKELIQGYIDNKQPFTVKKLIFHIYDIYGDVSTEELTITIPKNTEGNYFRVLKQGVTKSYDVIPVVYVDNVEYVCQAKKLHIDYVPFCT